MRHFRFHFDFPERSGFYNPDPVYCPETDSYILTITFEKPIENAQDIMRTIFVPRHDIELLEDQAVIIPLR
jgi:hypothetical protein